MAEAIYLLCAITSAVCAALLIRTYRRHKSRLLLWSSAGFVGLATNNALLFVDFVVVPDVDLALVRILSALVGLALLVWGLIMEVA